MTVSNNMFVEAMKDLPKIQQPTAEPYHVGLGNGLTIISDGITSLTANDVGKNQTFLDIDTAKKMACSARNRFLSGATKNG